MWRCYASAIGNLNIFLLLYNYCTGTMLNSPSASASSTVKYTTVSTCSSSTTVLYMVVGRLAASNTHVDHTGPYHQFSQGPWSLVLLSAYRLVILRNVTTVQYHIYYSVCPYLSKELSEYAVTVDRSTSEIKCILPKSCHWPKQWIEESENTIVHTYNTVRCSVRSELAVHTWSND